jgi:hypothetical protein
LLMNFLPLLKKNPHGPPVANEILPNLEVTNIDKTIVGQTAYGKKTNIKQEIYGDLRKTDFSLINSIIDDIRGFGGQVVLIRGRDPDDGRVYDNISFFFTVTELGVPQIAFNPLKDYALAGLLHEYHHFKNWKKKVQELWQQNPTLSWIEVGKLAQNFYYEKENVVVDERGAVMAEDKAHQEFSGHKYNRGSIARPMKGQDIPYYLSQFYPGLEAVRKEMGASKWQNRPMDFKFIQKILLETRLEGKQALKDMKNFYQQQMKQAIADQNHLSEAAAKNRLLYLDHLNLFDFVFMNEQSRFIQDGESQRILKIWEELPEN